MRLILASLLLAVFAGGCATTTRVSKNAERIADEAVCLSQAFCTVVR